MTPPPGSSLRVRIPARTPGFARWSPRAPGVAGSTILLLALLAVACRADDPVSVNGSPNSSFSADLGAEVSITLWTVGPGEYASPPAVSTSGLRFLDVTYAGPAVPAGARQRFRFKAVARGRTIVVFHHTGSNPAVVDTVDVR